MKTLAFDSVVIARTAALSVVFLACSTVQARPLDGEAATGHLVSFRPAVWSPEVSGDMSLDGIFDAATNLDFGSDLDLDDRSAEFSGDLNLRFGRHDLWISGFSLGVSGEDTLATDIIFGDLIASISETISTEVDVDALRVQYGFALVDLGKDAPRVSLTAAINAYHVDASVRSLTTSLRDSIDEDIPFPTIGLHAEFPMSAFKFNTDVTGLFVDIGDIEGSYIDASASLSWNPVSHVSIFAGYRAIQVDASDSDFTFDTTLHGPYIGVEIWF